MASVGGKSTKASGFGDTPSQKKDGYASGGPPKSAIGNKIGKTNKKGYSGPNVQQGSF